MPILLAVVCLPGTALAALTPVNNEDVAAIEASASQAFYEYLQAIEAGELADAYEMVLDPVDMAAQDDVLTRLSSFIKARQKSPVDNEAMVVRCSGDWALVVYQYDTTIAGKTARVITTAWMMQWEGFWRQFIVAPDDDQFWEAHQSDYERLQKWFDDNAGDLATA
jgi:DNA-binding protein Fis